MTYNDLLDYIDQYIKTNGDREITAAIDNDVRKALAYWVRQEIGNLDSLETSDKSNVVAALNELNELKALLDDNTTDISSIQDTLLGFQDSIFNMNLAISTNSTDISFNNTRDDGQDSRLDEIDIEMSNIENEKLPIDGIDSTELPTTITGGDWYTVASAPTNSANIGGKFTFDIAGSGEAQTVQFYAGSSLRINSYINIISHSSYQSSDVVLTGLRILITQGGEADSIMYLQAKFEDNEERTRKLIYKANTIDSTGWTLEENPYIENSKSGFTERAKIDIEAGNDTYQSANHHVLGNKRVLNTDDFNLLNQYSEDVVSDANDIIDGDNIINSKSILLDTDGGSIIEISEITSEDSLNGAELTVFINTGEGARFASNDIYIVDSSPVNLIPGSSGGDEGGNSNITFKLINGVWIEISRTIF